MVLLQAVMLFHVSILDVIPIGMVLCYVAEYYILDVSGRLTNLKLLIFELPLYIITFFATFSQVLAYASLVYINTL